MPYFVLEFLSITELTLSQASPGFYMSAVKSLLKTQWEKDKLLVTSNLSFSHSVSYLFRDLSVSFIKFKNCRLQPLSVWENLKYGKGLRV